jgi:CheY-like chemotaxis protein
MSTDRRGSPGTEAATAADGDDPLASDRGSGGPSVLVVDDDAVIRAFVARALTQAGYEIATAASGREALRLVADDRFRPIVVVTDIEMPSMTGVELAARLLALRPNVRVVMMTDDPERAATARRHPSLVDRVLDKPLSLGALLEAVGALAGRSAPS